MEGLGRDEDRSPFCARSVTTLNPTLVELAARRLAFTMVRNTLVATLLKLLWRAWPS